MRVVIIGGGFAGYNAAKTLLKSLPDTAEIVLLNPTDYFLYLPLLPEVAAGILDPRRVSVSLPATLPGVRLLLGAAKSVDLQAKQVGYVDTEDRAHTIGYDRLVLAAGSVNKLLPIPGVAEYAHGFRGLPEALYLRDHIVRQIELAAATDDPKERDARCTFVVVGAGYTGTEVAAQGPAFTAALAARHPELKDQAIRWMLLDIAPRVLPELDERLGKAADRVLRERGVDVRMKTSISDAGADGVTLTTGDAVPARTLAWCVGVRPDPLVEAFRLETAQGRLVVDAQLTVPGHPDVFACGDAAAVPDLTRPGKLTAMTAQHAERQGKLAGRNVAASLGYGEPARYRHHDLGFVVDLGAREAAANPLHIPLSGLPAKIVTRAYHLAAMPGNRLRTAVDWALEAMTHRQTVQLGLVRGPNVPLDTDAPELPRSTFSRG
ncbi:NADH dehydrogenase [Amycolatopsis xylanica]|uniref:NADH dehydrogenase n=1 Tax=Amycolatopsis xylanica TaxID=589385 RepID=A0A1H3JUQ1_9PSEU|nr:NAD(P)/FAD-dependent oxidoreductase [Amycolatopsis xylanica]SDY43700.1 NADH dehydrogenase [Amycolatopsis xylanica]